MTNAVATETETEPKVTLTKLVLRAVSIPNFDAANYDPKFIEVADQNGTYRKIEGRLFKKLLKSWNLGASEYKAFLKHNKLDQLVGVGSSPKYLIMDQFDHIITIGGETRLDALSQYLATTHPTVFDESGTFYSYIQREGVLLRYSPWGTNLSLVRQNPEERTVSTVLNIKTKKMQDQTVIEWENSFAKFASDDGYKPGIYAETLSKIYVTVAELLHFLPYTPLDLRTELERAMNSSIDLISRMPLKALQRIKINVTATQLLSYVNHEELKVVFDKADFTRYFARGHNDESFQFKSLNLSFKNN